MFLFIYLFYFISGLLHCIILRVIPYNISNKKGTRRESADPPRPIVRSSFLCKSASATPTCLNVFLCELHQNMVVASWSLSISPLLCTSKLEIFHILAMHLCKPENVVMYIFTNVKCLDWNIIMNMAACQKQLLGKTLFTRKKVSLGQM